LDYLAEVDLVLVQDVEGVLVGGELVLVDEAVVGVQGVPSAPLLWFSTNPNQVVGQLVDGHAQDVSEAVQLTLGHVEGVERLISLEELLELCRSRYRLLHSLVAHA